MKLRTLTAMLIIVLSSACGWHSADLTPGVPVTGTIKAGETREFLFGLAQGDFAHINLYQHEIGLSITTSEGIVDSTNFGTESAYLTAEKSGPVAIRIKAETSHARQGQFRLQLDFVRKRSGRDSLALKASKLEESGTAALWKRSKEALPSALRDLQMAVQLWKQFGDDLRYGNSLLAFGIANERNANYREADKCYERAMTALRSAGDSAAALSAKKTWMNLGGRVGEERGQIADLERDLAEAERTGDRRAICRFVNAVAASYNRIGDGAKERDLRQRELQLARQLGDPSLQIEILGNLAGKEITRKDYPQALALALEALNHAKRNGDESNEIAISGLVAHTYGLTGQFQRQAELIESLLKLYDTRGDTTAWLSGATSLVDAYRRLGKFDRAANLVFEMENRLEQHFDANSVPSAFFVPPGNASVTNSASPFARLPSYRRQIFWLVDTQRSRFHTRNALDRTAALQQTLPANTLLLEFVGPVGTDREPYVWIISATGIGLVEIPRTAQFAESLAKATSALSSPTAPASDLRQELARIAATLLVPLKGRIKGKNLVIVPDETFYQLPFGLLPDPDHSDGTLLGDHHTITYAPSGQSVVAANDKPHRFETDFLVVADPVTNLRDTRLRVADAATPQPGDWIATAREAGILLDGNQLPRLASAATEARRLRTEIPDHPSTQLLGFHANRDRVLEKLKTTRIAHIVSHGLANLDKPGASGLALSFWDSRGQTQPGILRFDDISDSHTNAELITLAACETAVGRVLAKQGIPSLANAFLRAGARRVVSSLWKVDDAATTELMVQFYKNLFSTPKADPGRALWKAQKHVAAQARWSKPYYWAGFVLAGDWRPL